jgi:hypothetical protein
VKAKWRWVKATSHSVQAKWHLAQAHRVLPKAGHNRPTHLGGSELHGFSMRKYVARHLAIASRGKIRLRLHVDAIAAEHLRETLLSTYQRVADRGHQQG